MGGLAVDCHSLSTLHNVIEFSPLIYNPDLRLAVVTALIYNVRRDERKSHDDIALRRCVPAGFTSVDAPHPSDGSRQNQGGVAAIITDRVTCRLIATPREFATFESVCFSLTGSRQTVVYLLLYRPGSAAANDAFFTELISYLEVRTLYKCQIIVAGDVIRRTVRRFSRYTPALPT